MTIYENRNMASISEALNIEHDYSIDYSPTNLTPFPVPSIMEWTDDMRERNRQTTIEQFKDPIKRERHRKACDGHRGKVWINDGQVNKRVLPEEAKGLYADWNRGRLIPEENAFWNYDKTGKNNPFYGKKHTGDKSRFARKDRRK